MINVGILWSVNVAYVSRLEWFKTFDDIDDVIVDLVDGRSCPKRFSLRNSCRRAV